MLADLRKFLLRGDVVDLAVAVVIGVAFNAVVQALVDDIINPLIAAVFGEPDISGVLAIPVRDSTVAVGGFLQAVLEFVIIGTALFVIVQAYNALHDRRAHGATPPEEEPPPSDQVVLLTQIRDALRERS